MNKNIRTIKFTASKSSGEVSSILLLPAASRFLLVLGHGAGAGMNHPFMEKLSNLLAAENTGTLRYNFPYVEKGKKSPDPAPILMETVSSAAKTAEGFAGSIPLIAGGKSMGGRMTSMAASKDKLRNIKGIVFFGFPLHAPGKASNERAEHLYSVNIPMLFLQGTRDKLADLDLLKPVIKKLKGKAELYIIEGADHSFHMQKTSGRNDDEVLKELARKTREWAETL